MSISKFEDIREVLVNHDIEIVSEIENDLNCGMCQKLAKEAFVTICGCTYCGQCISSHLKDGTNHCPGPKAECKDCLLDRNIDIYFDPKTIIRIGKLIGKCPNTLCDVQLSIVAMKHHIQICVHRKFICPYFSIGCNDSRITQETIGSHLSDKYVNHACMLVEYINNSRNGTDEMLRKCEERLLIQQHQIDQLLVESKQNNEISVFMKPEVQISTVSGSLKHEIWSNISHYVERIGFSNIISCLLLFVVVSYGIFIQPTKEIELEIQRKLNLVINHVNNLNYGDYLWKIDNFSNVLRNAKEDIKIMIESPPFYSHKYGYKLKLQMYPNGVDFHKNLHLSVRLVLITGIYDDLVKWPFGLAVKINFVNQITGEDIESLFIHSNGFKYPSLKRATSARNDSAADLRFDLNTLIDRNGFIKNDTVYLLCSVKR